MSCYFHQNIAYIAFKTAEQMYSVCDLRLYAEDDRLLSGRPRVSRANYTSELRNPDHHLRASSTKSNALSDIHYHPKSRTTRPSKSNHHKAVS